MNPTRVGLFTALLVAILSTFLSGASAFPVGPSAVATVQTQVPATTSLPAVSSPWVPTLQLAIGSTPGSICTQQETGCPANTGYARVTMTASASGTGVISWPKVQVAFVLETTLYDGVYGPDDVGNTPCGGNPCEESNAVPFFIANAQAIANSIQNANPHTQVTFALVDYFDACGPWDDCDGSAYHVDIRNFIPASQFGSEVKTNFQGGVLGGGWYMGDNDFIDNFQFSSSITALYGAITGSGLDWSPDTHHVIVHIGSTAPRDPHYPENMCVGPHWEAYYSCVGPTCEPSYTFANGVSPPCEGWVQSQNGNPNDSIAALARNAPMCTDSVGKVCTIDEIDVYDGMTDPMSPDWPLPGTGAPAGSGPGSPMVEQNVQNILQAGCDMAVATGGTWDGPDWYSCPNGVAGTLTFVGDGNISNPNTQNPSLFSAITNVGFGPVENLEVARGTNQPLFEFVPYGNIELAPAGELNVTTTCYVPNSTADSCQTRPTVFHQFGMTYLGWNWSTNKTQNVMYLGDEWESSFNVVSIGPPYTLVPIDACLGAGCLAAGSGSVWGLSTQATYRSPYLGQNITSDFPVTTIMVMPVEGVGLGTGAPPTAQPPPLPPPSPSPTPLPNPQLQLAPVTNALSVTTIATQATAVGAVVAGVLRVRMRARPMAVAVLAKTGHVRSRFDTDTLSSKDSVGSWE